MFDRYLNSPPEEQKVLLSTGLGALTALWLSLAWQEPMLLFALPLLALVALLVIRKIRRRTARQAEDWI